MFDVDIYNIPHREIQQAIIWLEAVKNDCDCKIQKLRSKAKECERIKRYRAKYKKLVREFSVEEYQDVDDNNMIEIIRQRLGCTYSRANDLLILIKRDRKRHDRKMRNLRIVKYYEAGISPTKISNDEGISRQQVYNVIDMHKENPFY